MRTSFYSIPDSLFSRGWGLSSGPYSVRTNEVENQHDDDKSQRHVKSGTDGDQVVAAATNFSF